MRSRQDLVWGAAAPLQKCDLVLIFFRLQLESSKSLFSIEGVVPSFTVLEGRSQLPLLGTLEKGSHTIQDVHRLMDAEEHGVRYSRRKPPH